MSLILLIYRPELAIDIPGIDIPDNLTDMELNEELNKLRTSLVQQLSRVNQTSQSHVNLNQPSQSVRPITTQTQLATAPTPQIPTHVHQLSHVNQPSQSVRPTHAQTQLAIDPTPEIPNKIAVSVSLPNAAKAPNKIAVSVSLPTAANLNKENIASNSNNIDVSKQYNLSNLNGYHIHSNHQPDLDDRDDSTIRSLSDLDDIDNIDVDEYNNMFPAAAVSTKSNKAKKRKTSKNMI
jgi:hypothetical protein